MSRSLFTYLAYDTTPYFYRLDTYHLAKQLHLEKRWNQMKTEDV
jgi:hypothetical protein